MRRPSVVRDEAELTAGRLFLGTSGWAYRSWRGPFYPVDVPQRSWLAYLSQRLTAVEVDSSFYRLPAADAVAGWVRATPAGFGFAVKASRYLTHVKRLGGELPDSWSRLLGSVGALGDRLAVVLVQLPASFGPTDLGWQRMTGFLDYVGSVPGPPIAVELRHPDWFTGSRLDAFAERGVTLVHADSSRFPAPPPHFAAGPLSYYRLHGPRQLYASGYTDAELDGWATRVAADLAAGRDAHVYFDNDIDAHAPRDALRLLARLAPSG